ncbi:MAG TPA: tellurite resistance TerB C-terminal domain-containing protein [Flavisolibacter sp.]|nr:tellurite resistance TerB C-terminal domain-containing protein [Flavisolibacter sp.]
MPAFIIVLVIFWLIYQATSKKAKGAKKSSHTVPQKTFNTQQGKSRLKTVKTEIMVNPMENATDDSIIDVTGQSYNIAPDPKETTPVLSKYEPGVPYWRHQYVYSHKEINNASQEQKAFYLTFKANFFKKVYLDVADNSNYYFILLFDLLALYDLHKDLDSLERQLKILAMCYPKTASYGRNFLIQKMEAAGDRGGVQRLRAEQTSQYQYNPEYQYSGLGSRYKTKLGLTDEQVKLLNKLYYPSNNFCSIEYCCLQVIRFYLTTLNELDKQYKADGSSLEQQWNVAVDIIAQRHYKYRLGSTNYQYGLLSIITEIHALVFKYCENAVREQYGHKRKVNTDYPFTNPEVKASLENILTKTQTLFPALLSTIDPPDEATEIELYAQNTSRWKIRFDELTTKFTGTDRKAFVQSVLHLGELNKRNPSVEHIFFEASKFISKVDKGAALILYIHYIYHDLKSASFDNKQLTKTIQKSLFKTEEQFQEFGTIINEFIQHRDLNRALKSVEHFYMPKRKRISLDVSAINEAKEKHSGTVELLNKYLKEEEEIDFEKPVAIPATTEEIAIAIAPQVAAEASTSSSSHIDFNASQLDLLELFAKRSFSIDQNEVEAFAKSKGLFKNWLIEKINELCYETIDDILIEEEDDQYIINENYYHKIFTK